MLKWTTDQLPEEGQPVYVKTVYGDGPFVACLNYNEWQYADNLGCCSVALGDSWFPIPTPADCEKWEALREAVWEIRTFSVSASTALCLAHNMICITEACDTALAALDAKEPAYLCPQCKHAAPDWCNVKLVGDAVMQCDEFAPKEQGNG